MIDYNMEMVRAYKIATSSNDPSTQNGAVIVGVLAACNEFPTGVNESYERWLKHNKLQYVEHAERNAIYYAAALGFRTQGHTMVCPWAACLDCARGIIQSGIRVLVRHEDAMQYGKHGWDASVAVGDTMLEEAGVEIIEISGKIMPDDFFIRRSGELWSP
jgi:dCMP deaminase